MHMHRLARTFGASIHKPWMYMYVKVHREHKIRVLPGEASRALVDIARLAFLVLVGLMLNIPVNNYGHVKTVSYRFACN